MSYDDPAVRSAYRKGAADCYESSIPHLDPRIEREIIDWLRELDDWTVGDPPLAPHGWERTSFRLSDRLALGARHLKALHPYAQNRETARYRSLRGMAGGAPGSAVEVST